MIENFKYKINTAAADFGIAVKDVSAIIKEHTGAEKKSGASLTEAETNVLFDALTQKNAVKNFKAYFELGKAAREAVANAKQAKKDQNLAAQMALFEQLKAAQEAEMAAKRAAEEAAKAEAEKKADSATHTNRMATRIHKSGVMEVKQSFHIAASFS